MTSWEVRVNNKQSQILLSNFASNTWLKNVQFLKANTCTQTSIHFFFFLQQNTKFYSCTQTAIRFFTTNYEISVVSERPFIQSFFQTQNTKFKTLPKRAFVVWLWNTEVLKLVPKNHLLFDNDLKNLTHF